MLQEHLEQLRETAEEEVAGLSIKLQAVEKERREDVARLEAEVRGEGGAVWGESVQLLQPQQKRRC